MSTKDYLGNLRDARNRAWGEAQELLDRATSENRTFTSEEEAKWTAINADIDTKDESIRSILDIEHREREAAVAREAYAPILGDAGLESTDRRSVDEVAKFLRGETRSLELDFRGIAREKRAIRSGADARELRDLGEDTTTAGGYTVPTSFLRSLYDYLEFYTGARQLGVQIVTTASGEPIQIPSVSAHGTAALRGEGTALGEADAAFTQVTMNAWKYGTLVQVSSELLADTGIDVLGFIAEDTARAIARATDTAYVTGSGSAQPKGIISTQAVGATVQTGSTGVPSYANLVDFVYSVNPIARQAGAQWFTLDRNVAAMRKIVDNYGRPLWEPNVQVGEPDRFLGYPIVQDPNVTAFGTAGGTHAAFGHFRSYMIRDVGTLRFEASPDFAFSSDLMTYRAIMRTDGKWINGSNGEVKLLKAPTS